VLTSVLTPIVYKTSFALSAYWILLSCLGVAATIFAYMCLRNTGLKLWSLAAVVGGLAIGQCCFVQFFLALTLWQLKAFAP